MVIFKNVTSNVKLSVWKRASCLWPNLVEICEDFDNKIAYVCKYCTMMVCDLYWCVHIIGILYVANCKYLINETCYKKKKQ